MIGLKRSMDSAIVQLVLALEKASVAAAKREISVVNCGERVLLEWEGLPGAVVRDGISLGSWVDVFEAGASWEDEGDGGGVGGALRPSVEGISLGSWDEVLEAGGVSWSTADLGDGGGVNGVFDFSVFDDEACSEVLRKFCMPFKFGTRKLYAIECGA